MKDSRKEDAATQQIADEAVEKFTYRYALSKAGSEMLKGYILSALERAYQAGRDYQDKLWVGPQMGDPPAQPQPRKARKEQAPRAEGSPASGERSDQPEDFSKSGLSAGAIQTWREAGETVSEPRGQQQEWTIRPRGVGDNVDIYTVDDKRICHDVEHRVASTLKAAHNAELAAECQRREQAEEQLKIRATEYVPTTKFLELREQLLCALAAIEKARESGDCPATVRRILMSIDLSALHERDARKAAEVRKPLVEALELGISELEDVYHSHDLDRLDPETIKVLKDMLAKVKE